MCVVDTRGKRERIDQLADDIALCAARIDVATHALLTAIRAFDEARGWAVQGARSCAHWLSWRIGCGLGAAHERVRVANTLGGLARIDAALEAGELSYCKVRAMTRVATPDNEELLLQYAKASTGAQLERICRGLRQVERTARAAPPERFARKRTTPEGMVRIELQLHPDEAALLWQALAETKRQLASATKQEPASPEHEAAAVATSEQAEVDSKDRTTGFSAEDTEPPTFSGAHTLADAAVAMAEQRLAAARAGEGLMKTRSGTERHQLFIHLRADELQQGKLRAELHDGTLLSGSALLRIACDSALLAVKIDEDGRPLDIGTKRRSPSAALMRALRLRDRHCVWPSCTCEAYLDAHHLEHWAQGGETSLSNTALLCGLHHQKVHEGGFHIERGADGELCFFDRDGRRIEPAVMSTPLSNVQAAAQGSNYGEVGDDSTAPRPGWDGTPLDLGGAVGALWRRTHGASATSSLGQPYR